MSPPPPSGRTTRVARRVRAPPEVVYAALLDAKALAAWLPPAGMTGTVHVLEPRPGGRFRMTLTYEDPDAGPGGKTTEDTDTFEGRFVELVPNERVVQVVVFESDQPDMSGEMRVTWELAAGADGAEGGTEVTALCEDVPPGIRLEDNEAGTASSLENLARLVEA